MDNLIHHPVGLIDLPYGTVVIDCEGDAWQKIEEINRWCVTGFDEDNYDFFIEAYFPVKVVYKPDEA